jgi:hypothetical protein
VLKNDGREPGAADLVAQLGAELGDEQLLEVRHELVIVGRHRGLELAANIK